MSLASLHQMCRKLNLLTQHANVFSSAHLLYRAKSRLALKVAYSPRRPQSGHWGGMKGISNAVPYPHWHSHSSSSILTVPLPEDHASLGGHFVAWHLLKKAGGPKAKGSPKRHARAKSALRGFIQITHAAAECLNTAGKQGANVEGEFTVGGSFGLFDAPASLDAECPGYHLLHKSYLRELEP